MSTQSFCNQFRQLTTEQRIAFVRLIANESDCALLGEFWNALPIKEQIEFMHPLLEEMAKRLRPILIRETIMVVKRFPDLSEEELLEEISKRYEQTLMEVEEGLAIREEHKFKSLRNRKSSPATIRQNVEICDLRQANPKKWSLRRLAMKYEMDWRSIQRIVKAESKWRQLASSLPIRKPWIWPLGLTPGSERS